MEKEFLRCRDVEEMISLSRSTIYRLMKAGQVPQPIKIGSRAVRWRQSDIEAWMDSKTTVRSYILSPTPVQFGDQVRSGIRVWRQNILKFAGHVVGPLLRQVSAAFEQVRSRIGLVDRLAQ